ncbi:PEF-CTERM sorting domain-containing protein [Methanococcoides seepicolus]|nr:PEF-CTERM sorting domain-containing protein [Methanococcoides seepicolus]
MIKKSLLITGLLVILISMVSVASASEIYNVTNPKDTLSCGDVDVGVIIDGNNVTVDVIYLSPTYLSGDTTIKTFGLNTVGLTEANITGITGATQQLSGVDSFSSEFGDFNTTVGFVTSEKTLGPITITFDGPVVVVPNTPQNFNAAVHLIGLDEGLSVKVADGECETQQIQQIPEFPTIALPIAAILGLSLIFMRRKE